MEQRVNYLTLGPAEFRGMALHSTSTVMNSSFQTHLRIFYAAAALCTGAVAKNRLELPIIFIYLQNRVEIYIKVKGVKHY